MRDYIVILLGITTLIACVLILQFIIWLDENNIICPAGSALIILGLTCIVSFFVNSRSRTR